MREVNEMEQIDAAVHVWSAADAVCTVECTKCGPLGVCSEQFAESTAIEHMTHVHGAEMVTKR